MPFTWSPERGVYLDGDGQPVAASALRAALRTVVDDASDRLGLLAERLQAGRLDTVAWREAVRRELRTSYGVAASLANGGVRQMTPADRGVLSGLLRTQYNYLDLFSLDLAQGRVDAASDAFRARARQYAGQATNAYETFKRRGAAGRGHDEERNVLGAADHCDECAALSDRDWVPLGALPLPGARVCLGNCACEIETRRAPVAAAEAAA